MNSYTIRPPGPPEIPLVRCWLPLAFDCPGSICGLVAVDDLTGALLGAATMNTLVDRAGRRIGGVQVFVPPESRRQGKGSALVRAMYRVAAETEMTQVATLDLVDAHDEACSFLHAVGMAPISALTVFETPLTTILDSLEPRYARLVTRHIGPRIEDYVPVNALPAGELLRFISEHGNGLLGTTESKLSGDYYCPQSCGALVWRDKIAALLLGRRQATIGHIDLLLVAEASRGTSAELVLMLSAARRAHSVGVKQVIFEADPQLHPLTVHLGHRWGADERSKRHTFAIDKASFSHLVTGE